MTHSPAPDTGSWWDQRYREGSDRWELGAPAPPLQTFLSEHPQAPKPPGQVLVPGCGRGHEAAFLAALGFAVVGLDFSAEAIAEARRLQGEQPGRLRWLQADLLDGAALEAAGLGPASCDGVLEHTCYCAIDPGLRPAYRQSMARLIKPQGWLLGLFWCHGRPGGPPYGSDADQLVADFMAAGFSQELWFPATNSAPGPDNQPRDHEWVGLSGAGLHTEGQRLQAALASQQTPDLIVVGSGLGGLCCGALAARHGLEVLVLEAHDQPGGAAHGFERRGFQFESGPSLWSGLGRWPSANPLAQVLRAVGESVPVVPYQEWGLLLPEGNLRIGVGAEPFLEALQQLRGPAAVAEWRAFMGWLEPYCRAAASLPLLAMRPGLGMAGVLGARGSATLLRQAPRLAALGGAFGPMARRQLKDPFLLHWVEMLCFLISGLPMDQTSAAAMATLFGEWFEPNASLDYPIGGSAAVAEALVRGLQRHGGELRCRAAVKQIRLDGNRAVGVELENGEQLDARLGVVSNASPWDTLGLLPEEGVPRRWRRQTAATPACASFLHWHVGLRGDGLNELPIHHVWVGDWQRGIGAERNMLVFSMPSLLDPALAPEGHHLLHAYSPANEPWELWKDLEPGSSAYEALKAERCGLFQQVFSQLVPDLADRIVLELQGTPHTHRRYLRVHQGSYGPAIGADRSPFPGGSTPIEGLQLCGAGVFPGIGVPPVAVSGAMAAHSFVPLAKQKALIQELGL